MSSPVSTQFTAGTSAQVVNGFTSQNNLIIIDSDSNSDSDLDSETKNVSFHAIPSTTRAQPTAILPEKNSQNIPQDLRPNSALILSDAAKKAPLPRVTRLVSLDVNKSPVVLSASRNATKESFNVSSGTETESSGQTSISKRKRSAEPQHHAGQRAVRPNFFSTQNKRNSLHPKLLDPIAKKTRKLFDKKLADIKGPPVTLVNDIDNETPPLDFVFIDKCVIREGVEVAGPEYMTGCECRPDNGRHMGCEYTKCGCLADAAINPETGKKPFPYFATTAQRPQALRLFYLDSPFAIFECNHLCSCLENCKNRNVQHGRKVPLEIFRTKTRGWGLRCTVPLIRGQFIDTYRGEIITNEEATNRAENSAPEKDCYLYDLDKFQDHLPEDEPLYCVDGQFMGGPTRFINHSCDPNCRQFAVLYNHADMKVYDLAFFALEDIPANTELTFDYIGRDVSEEEAAISEEAGKKFECRCGSDNCRGFLWL
ncbi:MAG: hypothetical protein M1834_001992 [Cirrosporium novae-zelandiae]|nr:MAG: hypothetical protein M1834_001992 [Cirrosporium novae-zelandiae]